MALDAKSAVKRGHRAIHTDLGPKELLEKLGRQDPCPCGSGLRFKACCLRTGHF